MGHEAIHALVYAQPRMRVVVAGGRLFPCPPFFPFRPRRSFSTRAVAVVDDRARYNGHSRRHRAAQRTHRKVAGQGHQRIPARTLALSRRLTRSHRQRSHTREHDQGQDLALREERVSTVSHTAVQLTRPIRSGVPIPRGSFGLGAPVHAGPQRKGELYGVRVPELGKGGTTIVSTPSHSRRGSYADGEGLDAAGEYPSRSPSPSPALGLRMRTVSNTSTGSGTSSAKAQFRRTMHFPEELSDKVRALRPASTIPAFADQIDFAAIQRGEGVPPLPALMPAPIIHDTGKSPLETDVASSPERVAEGLHDNTSRPDSVEPRALSDVVNVAEAPTDAEPDRASENDVQEVPALPVPAVVVEEVDVRTPLPAPDRLESPPSSPQSLSIPDDASDANPVAAYDVIDRVEAPTSSPSPTQASAVSKKPPLALKDIDPINDGKLTA